MTDVLHAGPRFCFREGLARLQQFNRHVVRAAHKRHMTVAGWAVDRCVQNGSHGVIAVGPLNTVFNTVAMGELLND